LIDALFISQLFAVTVFPVCFAKKKGREPRAQTIILSAHPPSVGKAMEGATLSPSETGEGIKRDSLYGRALL